MGFGRFGVILAMVSFFGCSGCDQQEVKVQPRFFELDDDVDTMMRLINDQRAMGATCGDVLYPATSPVSWNHRLASAAAAHNADMIYNEFLGHTGSDGLETRDRIENAGYNWLSYSEVLASGAVNPLHAFNWLMGSTSHCEAIMKNTVDEAGISAIITRDGKSTWSVVFGRD